MDKKKLDSFYIYLNSEQTAQKYLYRSYQNLTGVDAEKKSYENCNAFMYYLAHGRKFYKTGQKLEPLLQPILFFYGMVHLLKAVLLTKRPDYPESTTMLAHGVSTRKRKKKQYKFVNDEVKVQYKGLFPYVMEHLFNKKTMPFSKITMHRLLSLIPEISPLFHFHGETHLVKIGTIGATHLTFPNHLLDDYHLTKKAFINRLSPYLPDILESLSSKGLIHLHLADPFMIQEGPFFIHTNQSIYFPTDRESFISISEIMIHYLLLYNLSMVSRYETEWWGDLLVTKPEIDFPLILQFLKVTAHKIPFLLGKELYKEIH
ncbi:MAG TPA: YaaC family protein [Candidatus Avamphibacillus sp.]|nr:YaaC family protein [Candidatus Avamphibacillus sp.]